MLRQALWIVGLGLAIGLAAALAGARLLSAFLYGISPHDSPTFIAVPIVIAGVAQPRLSRARIPRGESGPAHGAADVM